MADWTVEPTPVSRRREARERARREWSLAEHAARRPAEESPPSPRPAPAHRDPTPEELAQVAELYRAGLVRKPKEQHPAAVTYRADE